MKTNSEIIQKLQQGTSRAASANEIGIESFPKVTSKLFL